MIWTKLLKAAAWPLGSDITARSSRAHRQLAVGGHDAGHRRCRPGPTGDAHVTARLAADSFGPRLDIHLPRLPDWLDWVVVRRLRVGGREVDLRFARPEDGTLVAVKRNPADLEVAGKY